MKLSHEQIERIRKEAEQYKVAVEKAGNAAVELWKARINMAIAVGEAESIDDIIKPGDAVSWGDGNCQCSARPIIGMEEVERR